MKLIHLSDLHIGKRLKEMSLLEDQKYILDQILGIVDAQKPDAVLICGDVYDKSVPSGEAVSQFDDFLCKLSQRNTQIMIISGNHDSPERLAFGNQLLTNAGIHISPVYDGKVRCVTLADCHGPVAFWLLPFLKPAHVRHHYPDDRIENYTDAIRVAIEKMEPDFQIRNVLLSHQFVTGSDTCDSEEISVGGTENVDASAYDGFDYVALGHIHRQQSPGGNRIHYCGTPLKYSLSEESHHKSLTVVELGPKGQLSLELIPLIPQRDLRSIRGTFQELMRKDYYSHVVREDYLHVILTDEEDVPEAIGKLSDIYPHILWLSYDNTRTRTDQYVDMAEDVQKKSPLELFAELYEKQNNQPMSDVQRQFMEELINTIKEDAL